MKITVDRAEFLDAVLHLGKVVGNKTSMPVLEGILISAEQGKITMVAYNLEMGMKKEIYANCSEAGDIVINARILSEILRKLDGVSVDIETNDRLMCTISCGDAVFDIMGMAASDYPEMPSVAEGEKINVEPSVFTDMVKGTIFAVSQIEGTKPILTGLDISVKDGILQFVGIDGFRLAIRRKKTGITNNYEFVVSGKAVSEVVKIIDEKTEKIEITVGKRLLSFNIGGYIFISRLLEGEFLNYKAAIPVTVSTTVKIDTKSFIDSVERTSLIITDRTKSLVSCVFDGEENSVRVNSVTSLGTANDKISAEIEGNKVEIGFNNRYLLDALRACDSDLVRIELNGSVSPILILPPEGDDFIFLVLPVRLKKND